MAGVLYFLGLQIGAVACAMVFPGLLAHGYAETGLTQAFLIGAGLTAFVAGGLSFGLSRREWRMRRIELLVAATLVWFLAPAFGALPLIVSGLYATPLAAYFEAVSAFTTTGATMLPSIETTPRSIVLWRSILGWFGGATTLIVILMVLAPAGIGGIPDRIQLLEGGARSLEQRFAGVVRRILPLYGAITSVCFFLLLASGVPTFDSFVLAFSSVSTSGLVPHDGGIAVYDSRPAEAVLTFFTLIGATSILWLRLLTWRRWYAVRQHREPYWMVAAALGLGLFYASGFYYGADGPSGLSMVESLWAGVTTSASVLTTTGFEMREGGFAAVSLPLLLAMCMLGGGSFSTAGGVKFFRFGLMLSQAGGELSRLLRPHSVRRYRFGANTYDLQQMKSVWVGCMAYIGAIATVMMVLALLGDSFERAMVAAVTALANVAPVYTGLSASLPGWVAFAAMSPAEQGVLLLAMIAGRLEILGLFALFGAVYWRT